MSLRFRLFLPVVALFFFLSAAHAVVPQTGWWFNPNQPGTGLFIEVQNGWVFLTTQVYDSTGQASWTIATGAMSGSSFSGSLDTYCCGQTLTGPYQPNQKTGSLGTISLTFTDDQHGTMTWPSGTVPIQRLSFT